MQRPNVEYERELKHRLGCLVGQCGASGGYMDTEMMPGSI